MLVRFKRFRRILRYFGTQPSVNAYEEVYKKSINNPHHFWIEQANKIHWFKKSDKVLDSSNPPFYKWFPEGLTNTSFNALDYQIQQNRGHNLALIYDSPITNSKSKYTFYELLEQVEKAAGVLVSLGVKKGDLVVIYMPMIPQAAVAMLACSRIGAIHSVVFGGFAATQLATRIDHAQPKVVISASCGVEPSRIIPYKPLLDAAINKAKYKPKACLIVQRPGFPKASFTSRDHDWDEEMAKAKPHDAVPVESTHPNYILYTSGTTGNPKGVVRDTGGHIVALKFSMDHVYNMQPGEVWWAASDIGWVVGHSFSLYGPLINGNTTIFYEGKPVGTPDCGAFWRVISEYKVNSLFCAPTAFRAIKKEDPEGRELSKYDLSSFKSLFLAGERADPDTVKWAEKILQNRPVIDHWWQTETGWPMVANCLGLHRFPIKYGSSTKPVPGYSFKVFSDEHEELPIGQLGNIAAKLPLPPGTLKTLWKNDDKFVSAYLSKYPGYYDTGDAGIIDEDGYVHIMSRTDDVINVAGHRLSSGGLEEVLASHPNVAECCVVGVSDTMKGQLPLGFLIIKSGVQESKYPQIKKEVVSLVREQFGAVAAFKLVCIVPRLPKTRSGKILRDTMKKIADGVDYVVPPTIEDDTVLEEIKQALSELGYPKK
eukprot:TRINITY_DN6631_c0_g1_i3.p1 TRINITY_DN6631_c0_g1~~TRINITY_DN6631_c0_g1_i3.p1  ORF type:complete len:654 (+),score=123.95 TRINITY_DN6631_c0_g1_i3:36-1997(+)